MKDKESRERNEFKDELKLKSKHTIKKKILMYEGYENAQNNFSFVWRRFTKINIPRPKK